MARLWTSGFELQNNAIDQEWDIIAGAASSISTTTKHSGNASYRLHATANESGSCTNELHPNSTQQIHHYVRFYLLIHEPVDSSAHRDILLKVWDEDSNVIGGISLYEDNTIVLFKGGGPSGGTNVLGSPSGALSLDTWYRIEVAYISDSNGQPVTLTGYIDGVQFATGSQTFTRKSPTLITVGSLGGSSNYPNFDIFIDDVAVNDSTGTHQNGLPGEGSIIALRPSGAGESTQFTIGGSSPAATNYGSVNDTPPDSAITFVKEKTLNKVDFYTVAPSGLTVADTINVVHVSGQHSNDVQDAATGFKYQIEKEPAGTVIQSAEIVPNNTDWRCLDVTSGGPYFPITLYTDPDTEAWTNETLDAIQIGQKVTTGGTNNVRISAVWAMVDYTPGDPPDLTESVAETIRVSDGVGTSNKKKGRRQFFGIG